MRLEELESLTADAALWENPQSAQKLMSEKNNLEYALGNFREMMQNLNDLAELAELAEAENDEAVLADVTQQLEILRETVKHSELEALLSGEVDANDAYLEVHAGSGGTEAQDWAEMLVRMYVRWAEAHSYKTEYVEETEGDVAGIKSVTLRIGGRNAYGWLKSESGVHRLVRISPFDSGARRHTSFASVGVYPVIDDEIEININEADCRVDTYRASGAGGQHPIAGLIHTELQVPAASTSIKPILPCVSLTYRPALLSNVKINVRNSKTGRRHGKCSRRVFMNLSCKSAKPRPKNSAMR